jgi:plastocyanin
MADQRVCSIFFTCSVVCVSLSAGSLVGTVRVLEKDGKPRETLKDCIAILEPLGAKPRSEPRALVRIRTVGKKFAPRVAWTTPGSPVIFPNQDHIIHNVFSVTPGFKFDTGQYDPGDSPKWVPNQPGLVKLYCNVHHKMNAFLWVVDTPWAQVLDGKSGVEFMNLPSGNYRLRLWHPETGEKSWNVQIGEGSTRGDWTLSTNLPPFEPHKNKFGKDYPPAKDEGSY